MVWSWGLVFGDGILYLLTAFMCLTLKLCALRKHEICTFIRVCGLVTTSYLPLLKTLARLARLQLFLALRLFCASALLALPLPLLLTCEVKTSSSSSSSSSSANMEWLLLISLWHRLSSGNESFLTCAHCNNKSG